MSPKEDAIANRKEQIMRCAAELFAEQGYYKTTTSHIASAAGVTQPYVFHFFKSKEQMYLDVLEHAYLRLRDAFNLVESAPEELTHRMGHSFMELLDTHRNEMLLLMQCFTMPEADVRHFAREKWTLIFETVKARFEQANAPNPDMEASMFISCGMVIALSEVLSLPALNPWKEPRE